MKHLQLLLIFLPLNAALSPRASFSPHRQSQTHLHYPKLTSLKAYGKGSEIWPECNEEPISLSASFPGGMIPQVAQDMLSSSAPCITVGDAHTLSPIMEPSSTVAPVRTGKRRAIKRTLKHLLHSAAKASSRRASNSDGADISKSPLLLAVLLVALQCVSAKHILSALGVSFYLVGVACWCAAPKLATGSGSEEDVNMPSLPAKGHVPTLISNPLGSIASSKLYRVWIRSGALLSLLLPILVLLTLEVKDVYNGGIEGIFPINIKDAFNSIVLAQPMNGVIKKLIGGHVFLVCCQALSEGVGRAALLPLPIRVLIPVSYNILRLSALHDWVFYPSMGELVLSKSLRILGIANLVYWYVNLGVFLPVAVLRYLKAHFYCVEASEVTVRKGGESSVGLL